VDVVRGLIEAGAKVEAVTVLGFTALLLSAGLGRCETLQYLLEEAGANMDDVNIGGDTIWDMLIEHLQKHADLEVDIFNVEADTVALTSHLRVMVLRGAPPPVLVALLSSEPVRVMQEGARLRARLPAYLAHHRAYSDSRCPHISLLPGVLWALLYTLEGRATTEELWASGLGTAP
jgi:hypothetical protein